MTNFDKLVRWDADYYKSLTDDDCIVCLTERQVYVLGQIIEQIPWTGTRWVGDVSGLDFDLISGNLEYRLAERMTCQTLTDIQTVITSLQTQILEMQQTINQTFNEVDSGTDIFVFNPSESVVNDHYTPQQLNDFGVQTETCLNPDKDAIYGACNALVRYINQVNVDLLERVNQAGNLPDQVARLVSAIPALGLLPIDEVFSWGQFIATELEDEYNATVDEALLQMVICDLFCIAVNSGCHLDFNDVYNYFAGKVEPSLSNIATTLLDLINFAVTGTFAGNDYFFYMCYFQLLTVGMGQFFFGLDSLNSYAYQTRAGLNSPDNDWTIFCIDCPTLYRVWTWDFANGLGEWEIEFGSLEGGRIKYADGGTVKAAIIKMPALPDWRFIAAKLYGERIDGVGNGGNDVDLIQLRPTPDSSTGSTGIVQAGFAPNGLIERCGNLPGVSYVDDINQVYVSVRVSDVGASSEVFIDKIEIQFDVAHFKPSSVITTDSDICT